MALEALYDCMYSDMIFIQWHRDWDRETIPAKLHPMTGAMRVEFTWGNYEIPANFYFQSNCARKLLRQFHEHIGKWPRLAKNLGGYSDHFLTKMCPWIPRAACDAVRNKRL